MFNGDLIWGISWVWYLVTILGVGGTIAFFVLDFALATTVFKAIVNFLWSTRIGWALVAGFFMFELADIHRSSSDEAAFAARTAAFEQAQKDRDQKIADDTRAAVTKELADQTKTDQQTDTQVKEFNDALAPVPATGNPFTVGSDACKLRALAGLSCGERRAVTTPVPKARPKHRAAADKRLE